MRRAGPFLFLLSLSLALALAAVATAGTGGSRIGALLDPYPTWENSTFRLADEYPYSRYFQVGDSVRVRLTLEFPEPGVPVESFSNHIEWGAGNLSLVSVTPDPSLTEVTFDPHDGYADWTYSRASGDTLVDQTLIVLTFQTTCSGYGQGVDVNFVDPNQNTFVVDGVTYYADTYDGETITLTDNESIYVGEWVSGYPGGPDIPYRVELNNAVPGAATRVEILFDPDLVSVTGVSSLIEGVEYQGVVGPPGMLVVTSDSTAVLPYDQRFIFTANFHLLTCADGYEVPLTIGEGCTFASECGEPGTVYEGGGGGIRVPDYTVSADVADVRYLTTATQYDVSFTWSSTMPTDDFKFWMRFPSSQLKFLGPVTLAGFPHPWAGADGDTILVVPHSWDPAMPVVEPAEPVFKLRFAPKQTFPAGTVFPITFVEPNEARALYTPTGCTLQAGLTLLDGSITLDPPPPPQCPALSIWDGTQYRLENNLLAACDGVRHESDVTEHYLITGPLQARDGELRMQISERDDEVTNLSGLALLAIDHPAARPIQVCSDGRIVELRQPLALKSARDHTGHDITALLAAPDQVAYISNEPGWLEVSYGALIESQLPTAEVAGIEDPPPKELEKAGTPVANKLRVLIKSPDGWQLVEEIDARVRPQAAPAMIRPEAFAAGREVVLRYEWTTSYQIDFAELVMTSPYTGPVARPDLLRAEHSVTGDIRSALAGTGDPVVLSPGQTINLAFAAGAAPEAKSGVVRDYVMVVTGRYENGAGTPPIEVLTFGLGRASPNPFNPKTEIAWSLDRSGPVSLLVYDVRGALVRTLVSGTQAAGAHRTTWDGRDDAGRRVSSGTYFCRLDDGQRQQMQKLLLVK